jgi:DNA (cytosine-5)-methyltransferase 1
MSRDCSSTADLLSAGWKVLRFWESQIKKDLDFCVETTLEVAENGADTTPFSQLPQKTFAEFFAGIGLMRMALERQGWKVDYANDIDNKKHEMYETHFKDSSSHFQLGDIHKIRPQGIPNVTMATASFPCNDLSLAGARKGLNGVQSSAIWGLIQIIEKMGKRKPPIILLENVTGFLTSHKGQDLRDVLLGLNQLKYSVDAFILDAISFVPQSRQRLFVVGVLDDVKKPPAGFDLQTCQETEQRPKKLIEFILNNPHIHWRLLNLPNPSPRNVTLRNILEGLPDDSPVWWSNHRTEYLLDQMSPRHRKIAEDMMRGTDWSYGTIFRRMRHGKSMAELRTDGMAGCLRTPRGGSGRQILFKAGHNKCFARLLTPRECARLMGADDFTIKAPLNQALFGFGDAVCVPVIEWIAQYYLDPLVNELIRGRPLYLHDSRRSS